MFIPPQSTTVSKSYAPGSLAAKLALILTIGAMLVYGTTQPAAHHAGSPSPATAPPAAPLQQDTADATPATASVVVPQADRPAAAATSAPTADPAAAVSPATAKPSAQASRDKRSARKSLSSPQPLLLLVATVGLYLLLRNQHRVLRCAMTGLSNYSLLFVLALIFTTLYLGLAGLHLRGSGSDSAVAAQQSSPQSDLRPESGSTAPVAEDDKELDVTSLLLNIYEVLQLMNFNVDRAQLDNSLLLLALAGTILLSLLAAREILQVLFYDLLVRLQIHGLKNHIVVCGLGRLGRQILESCMQRHDVQFVVLERDPQNPNLQWARQNGMLVVVGDGAELVDLKRVRIHTAREVFVVAGPDEANISCLSAMREFYTQQSQASAGVPVLTPWLSKLLKLGRTVPSKWHVHIMNQDLLQAVRLFEFKSEQASVIPDLEVFSTPERTAWRLLSKLGQRAAGTSANDQQQTTWHYILLGFGDFGQRLALSLAEQSHDINCRRVRMTLCDRGIREKSATFLQRHKHFCKASDSGKWWEGSDEDLWTWPWTAEINQELQSTGVQKLRPVTWVCRADFLEYSEVTADAFLQELRNRVQQPGVKTAVLVCFQDEQENFSTSLRLQQKLVDLNIDIRYPEDSADSSSAGPQKAAANIAAPPTNLAYSPAAQSFLTWPIYAWLPKHQTLAGLIAELRGESSKSDVPVSPLLPFGQNYESIGYEEITRSWLDYVARLIFLVWAEPQADHTAHRRLLELVDVSAATTDTGPVTGPSPPPWHSLFDDTRAADQVPDGQVIDRWVAEFSGLDWGQLLATADEYWRKQQPFSRYSNQSVAIHTVLKAAVLGLSVVGLPAPGERPQQATESLKALTYGQIRKLSEMEHNRWVAERLLRGWWFKRQRTDRTRWQLTPFDCLNAKENPEEKHGDQREKDARIILLIIGLIGSGRLKTIQFSSEVG